jgi:flagellar M-ring protein FliF
VNNRSVTDAKGKTTTVPLSTEEIDKLTTLVRESIGFNKDRGDSVKVINAPFKVEQITNVDVPLWKQPEVIDMLRAAAVPLGLAFVAMLVFFGLVRPALKAALAPPAPPPAPGDSLAEVVDDPQELPALPSPRRIGHLEDARTLAKDNPAAVAGIVRGWVNGEGVPVKQGA